MSQPTPSNPRQTPLPNTFKESRWQLFLIFTQLGLTSFGGPVAHLAYFRAEFVARRKWMSEASYADLVALCQFLPGPASSQVGMAIGIFRHGYIGALLAWLGFTLPSALLLMVFALAITHYQAYIPNGVLQGLKIATVAVVAQAVWAMYKSLCKGWAGTLLMLTAAACATVLTGGLSQTGIIAMAGIIGFLFFKTARPNKQEALPVFISHKSALICLLLFVFLLIGLPLTAQLLPYKALIDFSLFYQAGALVFGGGHVVLPLLQTDLVASGQISSNTFLAGYGAAQAVPGPLFSFAAFVGASMRQDTTGITGGLLALVAIFTPSFLLVAGALPFWLKLRSNAQLTAALTGINAAVVGLLLAAFINPVWTSAIHTPSHFVMAALAYIALVYARVAPWLVVVGCGVLAYFF